MGCKECGMPVEQGEYHPYAACLMFKACGNSEIVQANLDAVVFHGIEIGEANKEDEIERLRTDLEHLSHAPTFQSMSVEDWIRLRDWMADPDRRKANSAFTAGPAREAAYAFEMALAITPEGRFK